jgi:hypothetical protein
MLLKEWRRDVTFNTRTLGNILIDQSDIGVSDAWNRIDMKQKIAISQKRNATRSIAGADPLAMVQLSLTRSQ